jgi:capsular exopolysaccharide synthesis family protein
MNEVQANDTIDLRALFAKLMAKWWWFGITITLSLAAGVAYIKTTPKQYMVQAVMLMGDRSRSPYGGGGGDNQEFIKGTSFLRSTADLEDQVAILTSRTNVTRALQRLDFGISYYETTNFRTEERFDYPPFYVTIDTMAVQVIGVPIEVQVNRERGTYRVTGRGKHVQLYNVGKQLVLDQSLPRWEVDQEVPIGQPFVGDHLSFRIEFPADREYKSNSSYFFYHNSLDELVLDYRSRLGAEPLSKESNIVVLTIKGEAVNKEKAFLNKLMATYIEHEKAKQEQKGLKTINFIEDQITNVSDSLRRVESSIEGFRATSGGVMDVSRTNENLFQERSKLNDERSQLLRRRNYCSAVLEKVRTSDDLRNMPAPSSSGIDDPVLNNLVIEITKLSADIAAANTTTGPKNNPALIAMQGRYKNLQASLTQTAESLVEQAEMALAEIGRRIAMIDNQARQLPREERRLVNYERQFKLSDNLYNYLMEKRAEAGIAIASNQVDKVVVDEAHMEGRKAVAPNKKLVLGGAFLFGLFLPIGIIVVRDFFNDRICDMDELGRVSPIPVLAAIPNSKRPRLKPDEMRSALAESFRTARINLQYLNPGSARQVIGITSSASGEGKTFCAVNFSTILAGSGKRTLLIDADMRRPNVANTLGMNGEGPGLSTWLIGEATLDGIIRPTDVAGLDVITAGPVPPNPLELMEGERLLELLQQVRGRYDHVVIDASPMGLVSEYVVLMRHVDVNLYVVRERHTRRKALRHVNELYREGKAGRMDLLLNDAKSVVGDGYGYYVK